METMKKQWGKALVGVQEFVPSEYIAGCYFVKCNLPGYAFVDGFGRGEADGTFDHKDELVHNNDDHTDPVFVKTTGGAPTFNCYYSTSSHGIRWFENKAGRPDGASYDTFTEAFWFGEGVQTPVTTPDANRVHISSLAGDAVQAYYEWHRINGHRVKVERPNHS